MTYTLVVLVLDDTDLLSDVLRAWVDAGVPGATVLESSGLRRVASALSREDAPLFPSLRDLLTQTTDSHNTIFSVIDDDAIVDRLIEATERITGKLTEPHTGMIFVMPVARVVGGQRSRHGQPKDAT